MAELILKIKVDDDCNDIELPKRQSSESAGLDIRAAVKEKTILDVGEIKLIPTGLKFSFPHGYEIQVRSRSGLALNHGVFVLNSPGTIDSDYRGPIGIALCNLGNKPFEINRNDRIAQLVVNKYEKVNIEVVTDLDATERNQNGYGSTGLK